MNNLIIILGAYLCMAFTSDMTFNTNPINHIVSYESYTTMSLPSADGKQECLKNFYLFSNHLEKTIQVHYVLVDAENPETLTVTLKPLIEKESTGGRKQTITSPKKIGGTCDFKYKILDASYVKAVE